jgi:hypothetical protein
MMTAPDTVVPFADSGTIQRVSAALMVNWPKSPDIV